MTPGPLIVTCSKIAEKIQRLQSELFHLVQEYQDIDSNHLPNKLYPHFPTRPTITADFKQKPSRNLRQFQDLNDPKVG